MKEDPARCLPNSELIRGCSTWPKRGQTIKKPIEVAEDGSLELFKIRRTKENFQQ